MANSTLATYNANCMNRNERHMKIDRITPHYMAGNMGARQCADYFGASGRQASCNYCIGSDGAIAICVPEDYRAWTSSSEANDTRAVTIECANVDANGTLTDACYKSLVNLCADICKRHGINPHYDGTTNGGMTMHCQFAATSCPGNWMKAKITSGQLERDIKAKMGQTTAKPTSTQKPTNGDKWVQDCVLKVGDTVKSISCTIAGVKGSLVNVPALGGWVPLADVDESPDTKDGKCDNYLATTAARVFYLPKKVIAIDVARDLCKCEGCDYWVKCGPLMALR